MHIRTIKILLNLVGVACLYVTSIIFSERIKENIGENTFAYDGYGRRIRKNNIIFTYDADNRLVKQSDGTNTLEFVYDNNGLSGVTLNGIAYIYGKDVQSNIVSILDSTGKEVVQYSYDAWGNHKVLNPDGTENIDENFIGNLNPFGYRSYYYDGETHLYYLNTRYYDPETCRFVSQDDVSYLDPEHINGLNLFAYCGNNPVMNVDPSGCLFYEIFLVLASVVVGALIGGLSSGIATAATGGDFVSGFVGGLVSGAIITVGMALAFATGGVGGFFVAAGFGFIASFTGSVVQQSMNPDKPFSLETALISGGIGMLFSVITYGLCGAIMQSSVGLFEEIFDMTTKFSSRFLAALSMSPESFLLTLMFSGPLTIGQTIVDAISTFLLSNSETKKDTRNIFLRRRMA